MKTSMITLIRNALLVVLLTLCMQCLVVHDAAAQMPDCISNTLMYGVFSPVSPGPGTDSTELRSISFADGTVGPLVGGMKYYIVKNIGGTNYYGSSAMGLDPVSAKFYLITQMGNPGNKDIIMIDPLAPTPLGTVIGEINNVPDGAGGPRSMDNYHFVKMAIGPDGFGYALGVHRSSGANKTTFHPVVRFNLCATAGCSTPILLGYLPSGGIYDGYMLYNGDIAFDNAGNLYFLSSAFDGSLVKYTDTRLFRINAADMPTTAGTGTIPMAFVADFDGLDSTGASGIVLDNSGNMYMTVRRYTDGNDVLGPYVTELYASYDSSTVNLMSNFGSTAPASASAGDLGACYFPGAVLAKNDVKLFTRYQSGKVNLTWGVNNNTDISYFEIQFSDNGTGFETLATVYPSNTGQAKATYYYTDPANGYSNHKYYRIREVMKSGSMHYYSNITKVVFDSKLNLVAGAQPNPFTETISFVVELKSAQTIGIRIMDQNGRLVRSSKHNGSGGENKITLKSLSGLQKGIYFAEINVGEEIVRQKLIKQN